ncbi:MAG: ammonia-forming cytochrome c nitrite reductase subunit c552 [Fervidicoccaceae archaeon]
MDISKALPWILLVLVVIIAGAVVATQKPQEITVTQTKTVTQPVTTTQTVEKTTTATLTETKTNTVTQTLTQTLTQTVTLGRPEEEVLGEVIRFALLTHQDNPNTPEVEGINVIPAYGCVGCHFGKESAPILAQWGFSGHGGYLLEIKENNLTAAITSSDAAGWVYYDFKASARAACQVCHTSTGFKNFADNPSAYNPANNTFYLVGQQKELLYCWACHKVPGLEAPTPELRNPGPTPFTYILPANQVAQLKPIIDSIGDKGASNLCLTCHSGRSTGVGIKLATNITTSFGTFNSHYLVAGGTLFGFIAYEYEGRTYSRQTIHGTFTDSPCTACHMPNKSHTFEAVITNATGAITDITAYETTCKSCHGDKQALINLVNQRKIGYEESLKAIQKLLEEKYGIYWKPSYPYFYDAQNRTFTAWPNKDVLGAAFNLNMFLHEPGAYLHNPRYTKQVIYDTIDYLDDGQLNRSVLNTVSGAAADFLRGVR